MNIKRGLESKKESKQVRQQPEGVLEGEEGLIHQFSLRQESGEPSFQATAGFLSPAHRALTPCLVAADLSHQLGSEGPGPPKMKPRLVDLKGIGCNFFRKVQRSPEEMPRVSLG